MLRGALLAVACLSASVRRWARGQRTPAVNCDAGVGGRRMRRIAKTCSCQAAVRAGVWAVPVVAVGTAHRTEAPWPRRLRNRRAAPRRGETLSSRLCDVATSLPVASLPKAFEAVCEHDLGEISEVMFLVGCAG